MRTIASTALAGLYLLVAPVFGDLAAQSASGLPGANETVIYKNSDAWPVWEIRSHQAGVASLDI